jgi:lysophospholipase L1-like esterase
LIASRVGALLDLNGDFFRWVEDKRLVALNKLGSMNPPLMCRRGLSKRATECNWSNSLINEGNGVYTALGHSFSAGLGAGTEDTASGNCRRFDKSYAKLLNDDLKPTRFDFIACSGDVTTDLEGTQLANVDSFSSLLTVTIGGNDVEFAGAVRACVYRQCIPRL